MLLVLGNGIAGATAARVARTLRSDAEVAMVSDEHPLPYSRTALMYVFMGRLRAQDTHLYDAAFWAKNRIDRIEGRAARLDANARTLHLADGRALGYERLVLATGSTPRRLDVPGSDADGVVHLYGLAHLDDIEAALPHANGHAVVVGGGLTGVELGEMLRSRGLAVTFLVREPRLMPRTLSSDESALAEATIRRHGVDVRTGASVVAVETVSGRAMGVVLASGETIPAGLVAVAVGVEPNVDLAREAGLAVRRGVVVSGTLETSATDVFAAGDCAEHASGRVDQLWYTARAMGATAGRGLAGQPTAYAPGVPFNAAAFFDAEWQTTGYAPGDIPDGWTERRWRDDAAGQAFRLVLDGDGRAAGVSSFGMRLRHAVCQDWVERSVTLGEVLAGLRRARFDPEFHRVRTDDIALALADL
ncbi:MAG: FAD-dependent oxidoreductase [Rhodothermales bacterium]|nr:FAD-dependent oxidoreductase [Rhodothermales bacterium]